MPRLQHTLTTILAAVFLSYTIPAGAITAWTRIEIDTTGIYSISYEELAAAGFTDPQKVSVWGYGGCADPDKIGSELPQVAAKHHNGNLYFYGLGPELVKMTGSRISRVRNAYAASGSYFLTDTRDMLSPVIAQSVAAPDTLDTHTAIHLWEREDTCPARGGIEWFSHNVMATDPDINFNITNAADSILNIYVRYALYTEQANGLTFAAPDGYTTADISISRAPRTGSRDGNVFTRGNTSMLFTSAAGRQPEQKLHLSPVVEHLDKADYALIDYVLLSYKRSNHVDTDASSTMYFTIDTDAVTARLYGLEANTSIWDVTDHYEPKELEISPGHTISLRHAGGGTVKVVAFDMSQPQHKVRFCGQTTMAAAPETSDMVIIAASPLIKVATELASIHESLQGLKVTVTNQQEIFNSFSSGTPHPDAIRRYVTDVQNASGSRLRYLLIYGGAHYNNRITIAPDSPYVLSYQCESETYSNNTHYAFMCDDYYTFTGNAPHINGTSALMQQAKLAAGRLPVMSPGEGHAINEKIRKWIAQGPRRPLYGNALLLCDSGDSNSHMHFTCSMAQHIDSLSHGTVTVTKAYPQLHAMSAQSSNDMPAIRGTIASELTKGTGFMLFAGHCDVTRLGQQHIWRTTDADIHHTPVPMAMLATCDALTTDRVSTDIGRAMLMNADGGAMCVIGANRTVLQSFNEQLAAEVVNALYSASTPISAGELYLKARAATMSVSTNLRLAVNTMSYALGGDPAIPLYNPTLPITATIEGDTIVTGRLNSIRGTTDNRLEQVEISVYDSPDSLLTYLRKPIAQERVNVDNHLVTRFSVPVTDGQFEARFYLPTTLTNRDSIRITMHGRTDGFCASGVLTGIKASLSDRPDSALCAIMPEIIDFKVSEASNGDVNVYAMMHGGDAGISLDTRHPATTTHMILDNRISLPGVSSSLLPGTNGRAILEYTLPRPSDGHHTLTLTTSTTAGGTSSATVDFTIISVEKISLMADSMAVSTETEINTTTIIPDDTEAILLITDSQGRTVKNVKDVAFPYVWNLTDAQDLPVTSGCYYATVMTRNGHRHGASPRVPIIVVRDNSN